jgi:hypothetical protein
MSVRTTGLLLLLLVASGVESGSDDGAEPKAPPVACRPAIRSLTLGPNKIGSLVGGWQGNILLVGCKEQLQRITVPELASVSLAIAAHLETLGEPPLDQDGDPHLRAGCIAAANGALGRDLVTDMWVMIWPADTLPVKE